MAPSPGIDRSIFRQQYMQLRDLASQFRAELEGQLLRIVDDAGIKLGFPIQSRVKSWESIESKLDRVKLNLKSIKDMQDLVGFRIVLLFRPDLDKVFSLLQTNLKVVAHYNTQQRLKADQFGYSSLHLVAELPDKWLAVPSFSRMPGLKAEIQLRTLAQHIWAEASNEFQYKNESSVPPSVLRPVYRLSALLETVDLEFERILAERDTYRSIDNISLSTQLNVDLLEKTLDSLLPKENKTDSEEYGELLDNLKHFQINTLGDLKSMLEQNLSKALENERHMIETKGKEFEKSGETLKKRLRAGVLFAHTGIVRYALRSAFGDKAVDSLFNT